MLGNKEHFWIDIMEKLNSNTDLYSPIPGILKDLCVFFSFGSGFIYQADYTSTFFLKERHSFYKGAHMPDKIDLIQTIGNELVEKLQRERAVIFRRDTEKTPLQKSLSALFRADSMVFIPVLDGHGALIAFVGITDRRGGSRLKEEDLSFTRAVLGAIANHVKLQLYQVRAESAQKSLESIMDNMGVDIYVNDFYTHEILYVNRSMAAPYGGAQNMLGKPCWKVLYDDKSGECDCCPQPKLIDEDGNPTKIYSWDCPVKGSWFRVLSTAFRWVDGRLAHVVSSVDITENKRNEDIIRQMAEYDILTGLPNRRKLNQDCEDSISMLCQEAAEGYLLFFDLDGFKAVNDRLGHAAGDELLEQIGKALQKNPSTQNHCYRYGGDEFVILCAPCTLNQALEVVDYLHDLFSKTWHLEDGDVTCNLSIGLTNYPRDGNRDSDLLRSADMTMYAAKQAGAGSVRFYNQGKICTREQYAALFG